MESFSQRSSKATRKRAISSDSEGEDKTEKSNEISRRQSTRIHEKQHQPKFRLPSRDDIWKDIPTIESIPSLKSLTPRKSVNNFTKVYNDYNYDDYEDTSEDEISSSDSSDTEDEDKKGHRIKHYHKRIKLPSSSSDEDNNKTDNSEKISSNLSPEEKKRKISDHLKNDTECEQSDNIQNQAVPSVSDEGGSDENDILSPGKHFRNRSLLDSDDESPENSLDDQDNSSSHTDSNDLPVEDKRCRSTKLKSKQIDLFQKFKEVQSKKKRCISYS